MSTDLRDMCEAIMARHRAYAETPEGKAAIAAAEAEDAERLRKEAEEAKERPYRHLADCGVPLRVVDTVRRYEQTAAVKRVLRWIEERKSKPSTWCLVLSSSKGAGKSVAAGLWMLQSGAESIRYYDNHGNAEEAPSWLSVSKFARLDGYNGTFDRICDHPGPVVLDDIGSEYNDSKGWFLQAFDAFVDARYSQYRPTLITTNLSGEDFKRRYSERVVDRIREGGSYYEFDGESMRGRPAA